MPAPTPSRGMNWIKLVLRDSSVADPSFVSIFWEEDKPVESTCYL